MENLPHSRYCQVPQPVWGRGFLGGKKLCSCTWKLSSPSLKGGLEFVITYNHAFVFVCVGGREKAGWCWDWVPERLPRE